MGSRPRAEARAARLAVVAVVVSISIFGAGAARGDPILELPPVGRASLIHAPARNRDPGVPGAPSGGGRSAAAAGSTDPDRLPGRTGTSELALVVEMSALAVLGDDRRTIFPDAGDLEGGEPELAVMRVGLVGWSGCQPFGFALRADLAEALRLDREDFTYHPLAAGDALVDDLYGAWSPRAWAQLWLGRQPVPFSRFRHLEHALLTGGAAPFVVDRIAPERRWGAAFHGDLGALAYATGVYADGGVFEEAPSREERVPEDAPEVDADGVPLPLHDPSTGGRVAIALHAEWTPRAPMGPGPLASPSSDPWYPVPRVSAGAGALVRLREHGGDRADLSMNGAGKWRGLSSLLELILSIDGGQVALAAAGEAGFLATDRFHVFVRADDDIELEWWTVGGGAGWFVTADRWNKVTFFGWVRRKQGAAGADADGVIVQLQAAL
jgi:hypothetical protein